MRGRQVAALVLAAVLATGCGTKGDLLLPESEAVPAQPAKPPVDPPVEVPKS